MPVAGIYVIYHLSLSIPLTIIIPVKNLELPNPTQPSELKCACEGAVDQLSVGWRSLWALAHW